MDTIEKVVKTTGYFKSFDDTEIYYERRGSGETIVWVYGIACLLNHWHHQINYFSKKYQAVGFDLRGHHLSSRPSSDENLCLTAIAKDLKALLNFLDVESAHFVGHSFGAQVLLRGYELNPEIFKSMTFVNGFAKNPVAKMFGLDLVEAGFNALKENYAAHPDLVRSLWKLAIDNPLSIPISAMVGGFNLKLTSLKDIQVYTKGVSNLDLGVFLKLFDDLMTYNGDNNLHNIKVPCLVIAGENDRITPLKFQIAMTNSIPDAEFLKVPYGSHCSQLDFPEFINLRIDKFLNERFRR